MAESEFDQQKFSELVLYIAWRTMDDPEFGATKMAKTLWHADSRFFAEHGRPITGARYVRQQFGPVPREYPATRRALVENGDASIAHHEIHGLDAKRLVAHRTPDLDRFTAAEISLVDAVIQEVASMTAKQVSEASHGIVWELVEPMAEIPYSAVLVSDIPMQPTENEIEHGRRVAERITES